MHDDDKPARKSSADPPASARLSPDPVEEAAAESFPASDPPAWTATRAGKPESPAAKDARRGDDSDTSVHCEAIGLFEREAEAQSAADALLACGFNMVDIGPPRSHGNLGAGPGALPPMRATGSVGLCAALGALAAGAVAALLAPKGGRYVIAAAAGGAVGAVSAHAASRFARRKAAESGWPPNGTLLRVRLKSLEDEKRALTIIAGKGARKVHLDWVKSC